MKSKTFLIKLSAIGDVAMACRALKNLADEYDLNFELHWVIDNSLQEMAKILLDSPSPIPSLKIVWHKIDSKALFTGNLIDKIREALKISRGILNNKPQAVVILHRDKRYSLFARPFFSGKQFQIRRSNTHEIDLYLDELRNLATCLKLKRISKNIPPTNHFSSNEIGILIGGGRNSKSSFDEKRWPTSRFVELIEMILNKTDKTVHLLGGQEDGAEALEIEKAVGGQSRIVNQVGKTKLNEIPNILSTLSAFISVDSGLAHIASCVMPHKGQKIISLFGPTHPGLWSPVALGLANAIPVYRGTPCSPCYKNDGNFQACKHVNTEFYRYCMNEIKAETVFNLLEN